MRTLLISVFVSLIVAVITASCQAHIPPLRGIQGA